MRRDLATLHVTFACGSCEGDAVIVWRCVGAEFAIGTVIQRHPSSSSCVPCICNATPSVLPLSSNKLDVFPSFLSCGPSFRFKFFSPEAARSKLGEVLRCDARSRPGLPVPGDRTDQDLPTLFCRLGPKLSPRCQAVEVSQIACFLPACRCMMFVSTVACILAHSDG
jgi:hypothetical protein